MNRASLLFSLTLALLLTCLGVCTPASADEAGDALIAAAQRQDVAKVEALLKAGTPVDSANRYGATALFYAVDKGNATLVKMLLDAGANPDVTDTFYGATPLGWAMGKAGDSPSHREALLLLLQAGAEPDAAVGGAVYYDDVEMLQAAMATEKVSAEARRKALAQLAEAEATEDEAILEGRKAMEAILAKDLPAEPEASETPAIELTAEDRARYSGDFANDEIGMQIKVFIEGDLLKAQATGQAALTLVPTSTDVFVAREQEGIEMTFSGRGGIIERFVLAQGGQQLAFPRAEEEAAQAIEAAPAPALPQAARGPAMHWPSFRGPNASGIGDGQGVPTEWDAESQRNIRWKTPIPGIALASPVIWGERVFVATSTSEAADTTFRTGLYGDVDSVEDDAVYAWKLYALDKASGEVLWQRDASRGQPKVKRHAKSSHANPTPAADDQHVVVLFPSEGLFCYDHQGKLLWQRDLGVFGSGWFFDSTYEWGFASSPIVHDGRVIVQADIYSGSYLAAWDLETGEPVWRTARDESPTWSTPTILPSAKVGASAEIVTNGKTIRGYDAATGKELWTLTPNSEIVVGTPVVADGLAYVTGGYPPARPIYALRPGGRGDLTLAEGAESSVAVAWHQDNGGTYIPTPIVYQGILYLLHNNGRLVAYDATTGEMLYRERVGSAESFSGSPVAADGRLYLTTETGTTYVIRAGKVFAEIAKNELGEVVMTTPAISDGLMVVRGMDHVYGIGAQAGEDSTAETDSLP